MKISVIAVGKLKEPATRAVADDYLKRIRHFVRCEEIEVRDDAGLQRAIPRDAVVVALEVDGETLSSREFSSRLERWSRQGKGVLVFLIGGANGLPSAVSLQAQARLSLSSFTLPHRLARVVLLEQIYRAFTIIRRTPYARED